MAECEIEIEIGPAAEAGQYAVRVVRAVSGGEPQGMLRLDVDAVLERLGQLEMSVLASAEQPLQTAGRQLFEALFTGAVAGVYRASLAVARERHRRLRVVLRLVASELSVLPWEAMWDPELETYLCRNEPLVRHVPAPFWPERLRVDPPLKILGLVASPTGLAALDVAAEQRHLDAALEQAVALRRVVLTWLPEASWDSLHDRLLNGQWHILHFIGHGDYDLYSDQGRIALVGSDGRADWVEAGRLADLLGDAEPMPRLVVLNSCSSGRSGTRELFTGTAAMLVRSGIGAVAAMQFTVSDRAAVTFPRGFYGALAAGRCVDDAVRSGRITMLGNARSLEWVTPVLYVGGTPCLFAISGPPPPPPPPPPPDDQVLEVGQWVVTVAMSPDGARLTTGSRQRVRVWDLRTGQKLWEQHTGSWYDDVVTVAFSPNGTRLATGSTDKTARVWGAATGQEQLQVTHSGAVRAVAFSPDGTRLATASADNTARIWDATTGQQQLQVTHANEVGAVAFSPDGTQLATASADNTARIWDATTGQQKLRVGHGNRLWDVAFSPDGTRLATASADNTARIWDATTGQQQLQVTHANEVRAVAFSPDGTRLATGSTDRTARVSDASPPY